MVNPATPDAPAFPVPPPILNVPFVQPDGRLSLVGQNFLQLLWSALFGGNGWVDLILANSPTPAVTAALRQAIENLERQAVPPPMRRASEPIVRFYGSFPGKPGAGAELFNVPMAGDEHWPAGLGTGLGYGPGKSWGDVGMAPAADAEFPIKVNGVQVGAMLVGSGQTLATWDFASTYNASANDSFAFYAPSPQDAALESPRYNFVGYRS